MALGGSSICSAGTMDVCSSTVKMRVTFLDVVLMGSKCVSCRRECYRYSIVSPSF